MLPRDYPNTPVALIRVANSHMIGQVLSMFASGYVAGVMNIDWGQNLRSPIGLPPWYVHMNKEHLGIFISGSMHNARGYMGEHHNMYFWADSQFRLPPKR